MDAGWIAQCLFELHLQNTFWHSPVWYEVKIKMSSVTGWGKWLIETALEDISPERAALLEIRKLGNKTISAFIFFYPCFLKLVI